MSIEMSTDLEQTSSQNHDQADIQRQQQQQQQQQQQHNQVPPVMSQQQEQQQLQLYWYDNDNHGGEEEEEDMLHSWASRTFSATCYKFTIQNDPAFRHQGPLYSFLENWQLHTMYNKSQKILLGITDRQPCVLLTGDDFMFTPPPFKDDDEDDVIYQQPNNDEKVVDDDDGSSGGSTNIGGGSSSGGMDEHFWMLYQPTISPLHVVNVDDDDTGTASDSHLPLVVHPELVKWYQTVEHPTMIQRRPSTIMMMENDQTDTCTSLVNQDQDDDNITVTSSTTTTTTWRQWLQQGVMFLSQRIVEVAYLVAELAESLATTTEKDQDQLMTCYQDESSKTGGHYIVQVFRVWRVFFLGVETMLHRILSSSLDVSSPSIAVLPLLTKPSSTL